MAFSKFSHNSLADGRQNWNVGSFSENVIIRYNFLIKDIVSARISWAWVFRQTYFRTIMRYGARNCINWIGKRITDYSLLCPLHLLSALFVNNRQLWKTWWFLRKNQIPRERSSVSIVSKVNHFLFSFNFFFKCYNDSMNLMVNFRFLISTKDVNSQLNALFSILPTKLNVKFF